MRIKLGIPLTTNEIKGLFSEYKITDTLPIEFISTDTRELFKGDIFVAIRGEHYDGNDYIKEAQKMGAITIGESPYSDITIDGLTALGHLAKHHITKLEHLKHRIAITGSVGKTTTKEFLKRICSRFYKTHANEANFNNEIGVPLTILSSKSDTEVLLLELGMNSFGEIERLSCILSPTLSIITNIGTSHIGRLGGRRGIARAKSEITLGMSDGYTLVPYGEELLTGVTRHITVGFDHRADIYMNRYENSYRGLNISINNFVPRFRETHLLTDLLFAVAASDMIGIPRDIISDAAASIDSSSTRYEFINLGDFILIDDAYNASIESVIAAIEFINGFTDKYSLVLGDIYECGIYADDIHTKVGFVAGESSARRLIFFGNYSENMSAAAKGVGFAGEILCYTDLYAMGEYIMKSHENGETLLFKASKKTNLKEAIRYIKEKYIDR